MLFFTGAAVCRRWFPIVPGAGRLQDIIAQRLLRLSFWSFFFLMFFFVFVFRSRFHFRFPFRFFLFNTMRFFSGRNVGRPWLPVVPGADCHAGHHS